MMTFFDKLKARESEYKEFLAKMIRVKDAEFTRLANSEVSRLNKQRHRKTRSGLHDREWFWNEEIWCQDITIMAGEEFLGEKFPNHGDNLVPPDEDENIQIWLNERWDEVWSSLKKELGLPEVSEG